jgi:hypothetical protein
MKLSLTVLKTLTHQRRQALLKKARKDLSAIKAILLPPKMGPELVQI